MKRIMVVVMVLALGLVSSGLAFAQGKKPDATVKLTAVQPAQALEWRWAKGVLTYEGKDYAFKIEGLSAGDMGTAKAEAVGKVYNLKKMSDFNGTYTDVAAGGKVGEGTVTVKNQNGVVVEITPITEGSKYIKLGAEGAKVTLEKTKK
jgi:hypothetical protein